MDPRAVVRSEGLSQQKILNVPIANALHNTQSRTLNGYASDESLVINISNSTENLYYPQLAIWCEQRSENTFHVQVLPLFYAKAIREAANF